MAPSSLTRRNSRGMTLPVRSLAEPVTLASTGLPFSIGTTLITPCALLRTRPTALATLGWRKLELNTL